MVRDAGRHTDFGLLIKSLPYAFARLGMLATCSIGCILSVAVAI